LFFYFQQAKNNSKKTQFSALFAQCWGSGNNSKNDKGNVCALYDTATDPPFSALP